MYPCRICCHPAQHGPIALELMQCKRRPTCCRALLSCLYTPVRRPRRMNTTQSNIKKCMTSTGPHIISAPNRIRPNRTHRKPRNCSRNGDESNGTTYHALIAQLVLFCPLIMVRLGRARRKAAAAVEPVSTVDLTIRACPNQIELTSCQRADYGRLQAGLFAVSAALHPGAQKTLAVVSPPPPPPLCLPRASRQSGQGSAHISKRRLPVPVACVSLAERADAPAC